MNLIRRNLAANFAGQAWMALASFVFVPLYLHFIGGAGYGLVGFYFLLCSTASLLDMGFGATAMRQLAGYRGGSREEQLKIAELLRSIEFLFWLLALGIGIIVELASPVIASRWLNVEQERIPAVTAGLRLMAVALSIQFPIDLYSRCLNGLEKQVEANLINGVSSTLRGVGAVLLLWLFAPTVQVFFAWQCVVSVVTVLWLRFSLWRVLDVPSRLSWFSVSAVREVGAFTVGVGGINLLGYLLTQVDKLILSRVLPLQSFGYYTLAWSMGTFTYRFIGPVFYAYYPRFTQLLGGGEDGGLETHGLETEAAQLYLRASRVMAVAVVPFSVWVYLYAPSLLAWWTRDAGIAMSAAGAAGIIALGTMFQGLMHMPYGAQLAAGRVRVAFWQNLVSVVIIVPLTYYGATRYGLTGAALPWLLLHSASIVVVAPLMHRGIYDGMSLKWLRVAVLEPILQSVLVLGVFRYLTDGLSGVKALPLMLMGLCLSVALCLYRAKLITVREIAGYCRVAR